MTKRTILVFVLFLAVLVTGCDENNDITGQEEHYEAVGIIIKQSGVKVFDYYGPEYQGSDTLAYLDTVKISKGLNPHWDAYFYDEDSTEMDPPLSENEGGHQTLAATVDPSSLAELWWHEGEEGNFEFHIRGLESGSGTIVFQVMHEGHADFTTLPIPIVVDTNVVHDAPIGVKLLDEETESLLATSWIADSSKTEGTMAVSASDSTDHIEAIFFDAYGTEFWPGVPPHSLVVETSDSSIVTIGGQEVDEPWAFKLIGHSPGSATITVYIYHDGSVGKTFSPITVNVQ